MVRPVFAPGVMERADRVATAPERIEQGLAGGTCAQLTPRAHAACKSVGCAVQPLAWDSGRLRGAREILRAPLGKVEA